MFCCLQLRLIFPADPQQAGRKGKGNGRARGIGKSKSSGRRDGRGTPPLHPMENRDVWVDVNSDIVPPDIPAWTQAMQAVDKDKTQVHLDLPHTEKGYTFPDPNSLAGLSADQQAKKLVAWLSLRPATCSKAFVAAGLKPPTGSGAVWRSVLNIDSKTVIPTSPYFHEQSGKEKKTSKVATAIKVLFGDLVESLKGSQKAVYWHDCCLPVQDDHIVALDRNIVREIIWELFEHNFRFELRALDMIAAPSHWSNAKSAVERLEEVRQIFGEGPSGKFVIWNDPFPRYNEGLQGIDIGMRTLPMERLRRLMLSWPNVPQSFTTATFMRGMPLEMERLEYAVILFYCQSFFDFFGRPPIVPHRIPIRAPNCS
jgi:hypothetical protein